MSVIEREPARLRFSKYEFFAMLVGVLLYAATSWITNFSVFGEGAAAGVIRPGVAIPIFFGFVFGPITGFVVGFGGNLLLDFVLGFASVPPAGSSFDEIAASLSLNWQIGNGFMGLIPGIAAMSYRRYYTVKDQLRAFGVTLLAVVVGIAVASLFDPLVFPDSYSDDSTATWNGVFYDVFLPITITNLANAALIVPILLFNFERLDLRTGNYFKSGLMLRLLVTIMISAVVPIILLTIFLVQANFANASATGSTSTAHTQTLIVQLSFTIVLTAVFIITNAALMAQSMTRPLLRLTASAKAMERGNLTREQAAELEQTEGHDEIAQLSHLFGSMAKEVIQREEGLMQKVEELQILIDERQRSEQVEEIVETDFFRELKERARSMRQRNQQQRRSKMI
jgi:hypothetical protein